ncbi:MAG TPA: asparagine synthase C-terminal domain-containing protein, partial [Rubrobacter sp.]|nr:asparagine synthase C-terminal domain-containing protein [Rubrobacter sp.]
VWGGRWISFNLDGRVRKGRWFHPERVRVESLRPGEAVKRVRDAVVGAVSSRTRGERVALSLSGGRDSGSVAVATQMAGVQAECLTMKLDPDSEPPEVEAARELAFAMGHSWQAASVHTMVSLDELRAIPDLAGSPIGFPMFPLAAAMRRAAGEVGATAILDGEGGDILFTASPVAILELAGAGRLASAWRAARAYRRRWIYSYPVVAKTVGRALAPRSLLAFRERLRPGPPWAVGSFHNEAAEPRTSRDVTLAFISSLGGSSYLELYEQLHQRGGVRYLTPFYDQRVVRAALALPIEQRVPIPQAKPVLSSAFLSGFSASRVKATQTAYFAALALCLHVDFPWLFESDSLCARRGFVRGSIGPLGADARWLVESLNVVPTEMWVRKMEEQDETGLTAGV